MLQEELALADGVQAARGTEEGEELVDPKTALLNESDWMACR